MLKVRRQLTLFLTEQNENIEKIRAEFNPVQHNLIPAHITLCREDEIGELGKIITNMQSIKLNSPIKIQFKAVERFQNGNGVFIPGEDHNYDFDQLRASILRGIINSPRIQLPHITLMHPRNSTCSDEIFKQIKIYKLPHEIRFNQITLIEQVNKSPWKSINSFRISTAP